MEESSGGAVAAVATDYFSYQNGLNHPDGSWAGLGEVVENKGTKDTVLDTISAGCDNHQPYSDGVFTWEIPWSFRVELGSPKEFTTVNHIKTIDSTGKMTISKGGTTISKNLNDPTSNY